MGKEKPGKGQDGARVDPDNFSLVDLVLSDGKPRACLGSTGSFPLFPHAVPLVTEINDGEMLFLPAGWFHEVLSCGTTSTSDTHLALNYWFHPPDTDNPAQPYASNFWRRDWRLREEHNGV